MRQSYPEYIADLDSEGLHNLIAHCQSKLKQFEELKKKEYLVVSDGWMNIGFFNREDYEGALALVYKQVMNGALKHNRDMVEIKVERWYEHEVADWFKENK